MCACIKYLIICCLLAGSSLISCKASRVARSGNTQASNNQTTATQVNVSQVISSAYAGTDAVWLVTAIKGKLFRTLDGGKSWDNTSTPLSDGFESISFINVQKGWAIDVNGQVWSTEDGGHTWSPKAKLKKNSLDKDFVGAEQMLFIDELHGWIVETFSIWRTEDGGVTWKKGIYKYKGNYESQPARVYFANQLNGWGCGTEGYIYRTTDGGKTWEVVRVAEEVQFSDIFFSSESEGWLAGQTSDSIYHTAGRIYHTKDGGKTWEVLSISEQQPQVNSIYFTSEEIGWAAGRIETPDRLVTRGLLLHTKDGGRTWTPIQGISDDPFYDRVYFANAQYGWLVARDNIYRTDDGGSTWHIVLKLPPIKDS